MVPVGPFHPRRFCDSVAPSDSSAPLGEVGLDNPRVLTVPLVAAAKVNPVLARTRVVIFKICFGEAWFRVLALGLEVL